MRAVVWTLSFLGLSIFAAFAWLFLAMVSESHHSFAYRVFPRIFRVAMFQAGEMRRPATFYGNDFKWLVLARSSIIEQLQARWWRVNCGLNLDLSNSPNSDSYTLIPVVTNTWRPKIAIFFFGPIPDLAAFEEMSGEGVSLELPQDQLHFDAENLGLMSAAEELSRGSSFYAEHGLVWRGENCGRYSYVLFGESP